jgi:predicted PurR-regulated permease PerM
MDALPRESRNYLIFASLLFIITLLILQHFLLGILWGGVAATAVWPLFERLTCRPEGVVSGRWSGGLAEARAALLLAAAFVALVIAPLSYAGYEVAGAYSAGSAFLAQGKQLGLIAAPAFLEHLPFSAQLHGFWNNNIAPGGNIVDVMNRITDGKLLALLSTLWEKLLNDAIAVVIMLFSFYFMLVNGKAIRSGHQALFAHWVGPRSVSYLDYGIQALRGTINGVVLVGLLEGLLLSVPLVAGGLQSGLLFGLVAGLLGVIPTLMPLLILPCLAYMYLLGQTGWALAGLLDLAIVWLIFENAIKPRMISHKVRLNAFVILIAMIGGMQLLGLVGLFLGPAVVSMAFGMVKDLLLVPVKSPR